MPYIAEPDLPDEDEAHERVDQRERDDAAEKRRASGFSPELLSLQDALMEGMRAGNIGAAAGLNPYSDPLSPEYKEWERGRFAAMSVRAARMVA